MGLRACAQFAVLTAERRLPSRVKGRHSTRPQASFPKDQFLSDGVRRYIGMSIAGSGERWSMRRKLAPEDTIVDVQSHPLRHSRHVFHQKSMIKRNIRRSSMFWRKKTVAPPLTRSVVWPRTPQRPEPAPSERSQWSQELTNLMPAISALYFWIDSEVRTTHSESETKRVWCMATCRMSLD